MRKLGRRNPLLPYELVPLIKKLVPSYNQHPGQDPDKPVWLSPSAQRTSKDPGMKSMVQFPPEPKVLDCSVLSS